METEQPSGDEEHIEVVERALILEPCLAAEPESMALHDRMTMHGVPGVSVALIENGRIAWARGYGVRDADGEEPVTPETMFQAGSIGKAVTAAAVMRLVQDGTLDLDRDVNTYLRSWQIPANGGWQPHVTLRHLMSHTAGTTIHGFQGYGADDPLPSVLQILDGLAPANTRAVRVNAIPGLQFRYSGGGTTIVQLLLMDVLDRPFPDLMRELVLDSMGMAHSTFEQTATDDGTDRASGHHMGNDVVRGRWRIFPEMAAAGFWSTPSDLATFVVGIQQSLDGIPGSFLHAGMAREMLTAQTGPFVALGFFLAGRENGMRFGHEGDTPGYQAEMLGFIKGGRGAVIMTNSGTAGTLRKDILRSLAHEYGWPDLGPVRPKQISLAPEWLRQFVGRYRMLGRQDEPLSLLEKDGALHLEVGEQAPLPLLPGGNSTFFSPAANVEIELRGSPVTCLILHIDGQEIEARRVACRERGSACQS